MSCIYLIIASNSSEHVLDEKTQKETWASNLGQKVLWLRGGDKTWYDSENRTLFVEIEETYRNILTKTVMGIKWCLDNLEFDYLIRGNVSTYFSDEQIQKLLSALSSENKILGGYPDFIKRKELNIYERLFINGGAIFLSKESAKILGNMDTNEWSGFPDDFAISRYLVQRGADILQIPRGNVSLNSILNNRIYYRMKSSNNSLMATKRMKNLHRICNATNRRQRIKEVSLFYLDEIRNFRSNFHNPYRYLLSIYSIFSVSFRVKRVMKDSR